MRITGIGGTGVVTVAPAHLDSGASWVASTCRPWTRPDSPRRAEPSSRTSRSPTPPVFRPTRSARAQADLYLGCDVLVAASETYLSVASQARTVAVVSTAEVPTGSMVASTEVLFPELSETVGRIEPVSRADHSRYVDARQLTKDLFDDDQYANVFLLGVAFQSGALPLRAADIEQAIELNAVAVERNIQAFRRGRQQVSDQSAVLSTISSLSSAPAAEAPSAAAVDIASVVQGGLGLRARRSRAASHRRPDRLPERALCTPLRRTDREGSCGRAASRTRQHPAQPRRGAAPPQADGLQG